jgi:hypothetical protein
LPADSSSATENPPPATIWCGTGIFLKSLRTNQYRPRQFIGNKFFPPEDLARQRKIFLKKFKPSDIARDSSPATKSFPPATMRPTAQKKGTGAQHWLAASPKPLVAIGPGQICVSKKTDDNFLTKISHVGK